MASITSSQRYCSNSDNIPDGNLAATISIGVDFSEIFNSIFDPKNPAQGSSQSLQAISTVKHNPDVFERLHKYDFSYIKREAKEYLPKVEVCEDRKGNPILGVMQNVENRINDILMRIYFAPLSYHAKHNGYSLSFNSQTEYRKIKELANNPNIESIIKDYLENEATFSIFQKRFLENPQA